MRFLLYILLFFTLNVAAQTTNFSFTPVTTDFIRPGAGATLWNNEQPPYGTMHIPVSGSPQVPMDYYWRFYMTDFFNNKNSLTDSSYNFSFYRSKMVAAITQRQRVRFRIMSVCDCDFNGNNGMANYAGGNAVYPGFLHTLMQAETPKDWFSSGVDQWVPNWNSPQFARWAGKLLTAIRSYNDTASYNGFLFKHALGIFDLSFYGNYGEQHSVNIVPNAATDYPAGTGPTAAGLDSLASKQLQAMKGYSIVVPFGAYDAQFLNVIWNPPAYAEWLLNHADSIGWINDHLSSDEGYDHAYLENNNRINSGAKAKLDNRWKSAPIGGEPPGFIGNPANMAYLPGQITTYHMSFFGNGNYAGYTNASTVAANNARQASKNAGFRLRLTGGSANTSGGLTINLSWINEGVAPTYEYWRVQYLIKNGAGTTVSTLTSAFQPKRFLPSGSPTTANDIYSSPAIPAGTYGLYVIVRDTTGYRLPMPLAITGRQTDGSYFLSNITLGAGPSNQSPIADAGPNQSITGTSVSLVGSGSSDPDGTITTYAWTRLSGPNTPTIVSASSANTSVTGLVAGTYVFNLLVTDNNGATSGDNVTITVNNPIPPVANAGPNQAISLPTTAVTVDGSASTDNVAIVSYRWDQTNGPNTANIVSPNSVNSTINGLIAGTYGFQLTVTDGSALTATDEMLVFVSSGNTPPIANAGPNQTVVLPIVAFQTILLDGSLSSDPGGGIATYLWSQVGGPGSTTITAPTNVSTYINNLTVAGSYIFRLQVTDNAGLVSTDDVQVNVLPAPNTAPIANAGANQNITLPTNTVNVSGSASTDDVGIMVYTWSRLSGPLTYTIVSPNSVNTTINNLVAGVYEFRLTVSDGGGLTSTDDVTITVFPVPNTAPIANAGGNQSITLPTNSTSVSGSGSTDNIAVVGYLWTKVSGPSGGAISTPTTVSTNITGLLEGTYVYNLRVTDGSGLTDNDQVTITVNPAPNNGPLSIPGPNQTITLPTNSVTVDGSGSTDDVGITQYVWYKASGPASYTIVSETSAITNITNLTEGIYFFHLTVTDAGGLIDTDQIIITVNAAPVIPPVVGNKSHFRTNRKFLPRQ